MHQEETPVTETPDYQSSATSSSPLAGDAHVELSPTEAAVMLSLPQIYSESSREWTDVKYLLDLSMVVVSETDPKQQTTLAAGEHFVTPTLKGYSWLNGHPHVLDTGAHDGPLTDAQKSSLAVGIKGASDHELTAFHEAATSEMSARGLSKRTDNPDEADTEEKASTTTAEPSEVHALVGDLHSRLGSLGGGATAELGALKLKIEAAFKWLEKHLGL